MTIALLRPSYLQTASVAAAVAVGVIAQSASAQAQAAMDVSAGATAATNPYLLAGPSTVTAGVDLKFSPSLLVQSADAIFKVKSSVELERFFDRYGLDESVTFGASGERRIDQRTTVGANVDFRSSKSAARRFYAGEDITDFVPGQFPQTPEVDPTVASALGRTTRLSVNASLTHLLAPKSTFAASAGLGLTRVESASGADYRDTNTALTYIRVLSETTSAVITIEAGYADYLGQRLGDGFFATSLAGVDHRFTRSLHLSAQIGASTVFIQGPGGSSRATTSLAGNLNLCDEEAMGTVCLTGSRSARPTSFGGLTTVSSFRLSYSRTAGPRARLSFAGSFTRSNRSIVSVPTSETRHSQLLNMSSTYRRELGERIAAFVTPSFTSIKDRLSGRRENFQVLIGVSRKFGRTR